MSHLKSSRVLGPTYGMGPESRVLGFTKSSESRVPLFGYAIEMYLCGFFQTVYQLNTVLYRNNVYQSVKQVVNKTLTLPAHDLLKKSGFLETSNYGLKRCCISYICKYC